MGAEETMDSSSISWILQAKVPVLLNFRSPLAWPSTKHPFQACHCSTIPNNLGSQTLKNLLTFVLLNQLVLTALIFPVWVGRVNLTWSKHQKYQKSGEKTLLIRVETLMLIVMLLEIQVKSVMKPRLCFAMDVRDLQQHRSSIGPSPLSPGWQLYLRRCWIQRGILTWQMRRGGRARYQSASRALSVTSRINAIPERRIPLHPHHLHYECYSCLVPVTSQIYFNFWIHLSLECLCLFSNLSQIYFSGNCRTVQVWVGSLKAPRSEHFDEHRLFYLFESTWNGCNSSWFLLLLDCRHWRVQLWITIVHLIKSSIIMFTSLSTYGFLFCFFFLGIYIAKQCLCHNCFI